MAQRRYGPTRGAGVAVIEKEGDKTIEPAALGRSGYAGILEKGKPGELIECPSATSFFKKCGSYLDESLLPDACRSYYRLANGAGGIFLVRVTDGNEVQAEIPLYSRKASRTLMGKIKAHNGGRWGGKNKVFEHDTYTGVTAITVTTGVTMLTDQWKGGRVTLSAVPNSSYLITGNTIAGVVTVAADADMAQDIIDAGGPPNTQYYLALENETKALSVTIGDGEEKPDTEFSISVYVDGVFVKKYPNLATDPTDSRYWASIINNDDANDEIWVEDLWVGAHTANVRPADRYDLVETIGAPGVGTIGVKGYEFVINSPGGGDPIIVMVDYNDDTVAQILTITMTDPTTGTVESDVFGTLDGLILATPFADGNKHVPSFLITAGASPLAATDTIIVVVKPVGKTNALVNGFLYPNKVDSKLLRYRIVANDQNVITVSIDSGFDLGSVTAVDKELLVEAPIELEGGIDGNADIGDADYTQVWDTGSSVFNRLFGRGVGIVKMATPGVTSTAVQKAGIAYAEAKNHQYRYEIPDSIITESGAILYINDTIGRNDFAVVSFPSYSYVADPFGNGEGKRKLVSSTGMAHGREARIAGDFNGYHKAEAGVEATLPEILALPTGEAILDEEQLTPVGINVIKKKSGNYVLWGDRTLHLDPTWKWKHQREQMSWYEHILAENFDWIVFAINDTDKWNDAKTALLSLFLKEWRPKRALRGDTFAEAAIIKVDAELNTTVTMAGGDLNAAVSLRLADTIERFIITIGKQGIFDSVA